MATAYRSVSVEMGTHVLDFELKLILVAIVCSLESVNISSVTKERHEHLEG